MLHIDKENLRLSIAEDWNIFICLCVKQDMFADGRFCYDHFTDSAHQSNAAGWRKLRHDRRCAGAIAQHREILLFTQYLC